MKYKLNKKTAKRMFKECLEHLAKDKYNIFNKNEKHNIPFFADKDIVFEKYNTINISGYFLNDSIFINNSKKSLINKNIVFNEYFHYNHDFEIGGVPTYDKIEKLWLVIAHETCHYIVDKYGGELFDKRYSETRRDNRRHGKMFQEIYLWLRRDFINPKLKYYKKGKFVNIKIDEWDNIHIIDKQEMLFKKSSKKDIKIYKKSLRKSLLKQLEKHTKTI